MISSTGINAHPEWEPAQLECPEGSLVTAACPSEPPGYVYESLDPVERLFAQSLTGNRRREWIAGRYCLAEALSRCAAPRVALLPSTSGAPQVPEGFAGSITHKGPVTIALASNSHQNVGVDLEWVDRADVRLAHKVLTPTERRPLSTLRDDEAVRFVTAHFALKEAVYKAATESEQLGMDFHDIELSIDSNAFLRQCTWHSVVARAMGRAEGGRAFVFVDGSWIVAVATRD